MTHLVKCLPFKHEDQNCVSRGRRQRQEDPSAHPQVSVDTLVSSRFSKRPRLQNNSKPLASMHIRHMLIQSKRDSEVILISLIPSFVPSWKQSVNCSMNGRANKWDLPSSCLATTLVVCEGASGRVVLQAGCTYPKAQANDVNLKVREGGFPKFQLPAWIFDNSLQWLCHPSQLCLFYFLLVVNAN